MLAQQIMNILLLACMYGVIAIGFSLFFGVLDVVVFSCGDIAIAGAFSFLLFYLMMPSIAGLTGFPLLAVVLVLIIGAALMSGLVTLLAFYSTIKPYEGKSVLMPLLTTIAFGVIIREVIGLGYPQGRNPQMFPTLVPDGSFFGSTLFTYERVTILVITMAIFAILFLIVNKTKFGKSIQAISQNRTAAVMCGVNPIIILPLTFLLGGFLLGIGGFLVGSYYNIVTFQSGSMLGLKGFSAAVIGGLGNVYGAIVGALLIAAAEVLVSGYVPGGAAYAGISAFLVVVVFMVFRPQGILGETTIDKV
jgi:branched-chain amino acid transport system permease protein